MPFYVDKFRCQLCEVATWAVGPPLTCPQCGGTMKVEVQGTTVESNMDLVIAEFLNKIERFKDEH